MADISMISPDGTLVRAGSGGGLVTGDGVWTFSAGKTSTGNYVLLNGQPVAYVAGVELKVANGGKLYSCDTTGQWYAWSGSRWLSWVDPTLASAMSPDGTLVQAGSGGGLVTGDGVWTFSAGKTSTGNYILLNGQPVAYVAGVGLKVANGGHLYSLNSQGQWFHWTGTKWSAIANPNPLVTTLASDTGSATSDGITSNPTIKGTGEVNTVVAIKQGDAVLGTTTADSTGAWSFTPTGLADGAHMLTATQTDLAGNTGTATLSFTLDKTPPVVSIALVSDTGSSSNDGVTSDPAVKGVGQANTVVTVKEGGTVLGTTTADGTGAWSFTPSGLADGAHTLTATQTDLAGNTGTATLNFTLDSAPASSALVGTEGNDIPTGALVGTADNDILTGTVIGHNVIYGLGGNDTISVQDAHATTELYGDDGNDTIKSSIWGNNYIDGGLGNDVLYGHWGTDTVLGGEGDDRVDGGAGDDRIYTGSGNDIIQGGYGNDTIHVGPGDNKIDGGPGIDTAVFAGNYGDYGLVFENGVITIAGIEGTSTLRNIEKIQFQDNSYDIPAGLFLLDPAVPAVSIALVSDTGGSASDRITSNPAVTGTGQADTVVTIRQGGTVLGTTTADSTGAWSFTPTGLADGTHTLIATQTHQTGHIRTAMLSFTLDTTAPTVGMVLASDTGSSASDGITSNPAVKGTGQANMVVTIKEGATTLGTTTANSTGAWSFTPTGLAKGAHTSTAIQTDHAGNTGTATLSFTLDTASQPTPAPTSPQLSPSQAVLAPAVPQPSQSGDIVGLLLQNTGTVAEKSGYVTFGQVFKPGAIMLGDTLVARIGEVDYAVQMDVKATHSDGSVRHATLTLNAPAIAAGGIIAMMLAKDSAPMPSPAEPNAPALLASGYDVTVAFTFRNADGTTTTDSASAAAALQAAIAAGNVRHWLTGPAVNEYNVVTTVNDGKLKVEFDIRVYADGTTTTDVIFDNSWMFSPGKTNLVYDVAISQGGEQVYSAGNVSQYLYSLWHHRVDSAGTTNPHVQYDIAYLTAAAALPAYDRSYGVSSARIQTNYSKLDPASSTGHGSTGPMGIALVQPLMPTTGGRPDIGTQTTWTAQWLLSQNSTAAAVMMANADAAGGIPWHLTDETTGAPISLEDYPLFWQDPRNVAGLYWSPHPANGWLSYGANGNPWKPDTAHMPDLNYVPYLTTGDHYQLKLLQSAANYAITSINPYYAYSGNAVVDPRRPGDAVYMGVADPANQQRAIAWGLREVAEAAYATPDGDPLKSYFTSQLVRAMDGLVQEYIVGKGTAAYGELQGFVLGAEVASGVPIVSPFQQSFIVTILAEIAGMNLPQASDDAVQMMKYMTNFVAGLYTNGENGYAPANGAPYWLYLKDPVSKTAYSTWSEFSAGNVTAHTLNKNGYGLPTANPESMGESRLISPQSYPAIAKAALADLITYTQSPQAMEAYGYIVNQIAAAWAGNDAGMAASYQADPTWSAMPRLPNGEYLSASQMQIDTSNSNTVVLTAIGGPSLLSVVGNGTATMTGGDDIDLLFGGSGPATLIAGTGNDYLFAGAGATTFFDHGGDDYMKGGPGDDTFTFADGGPGHDIIVNFKIGADILKIASNLNDNGITSAAELVSGAEVVEASTVLHLGSGHDVTIRGIDTPSALVNSIIMI
ncbi:MAG: Ig-like domain-containing protein [Alphaproteobacteria bacterium]